MLCCGAQKTARPTPSQAEEPAEEYKDPADDSETVQDVLAPSIAPNFQPKKIDRPLSSELERPEKRPGSANGVKAPLFSQQEKEQLWVNRRVLEIKHELQKMGLEMTDSQILEVARAESSRITVERNVLASYEDSDDKNSEYSGYSDDSLVDVIGGAESDVELEPSPVRTAIETTTTPPKDEITSQIQQELKEINREAIARSNSERELAAMLGEDVDDIGVNEVMQMPLKQGKSSKDVLILGDVILD